MTDQNGAKNSEFSFDKIQNFDTHIAQSIPNYELMVSSIVRLSDYFKDENKVIFDIGCSTGKLLKYFKRTNNYKGKMIGIDVSRNLLPTTNEDNLTFVEHDLTKPYVFDNACIVFCLYTMQFLPKESRDKLLKSIYDGLVDGGALFISEKVYCDVGMFQDMFTSTYYDYKKESFTDKEIFDKERSLRTLLKPRQSSENLFALQKAGFRCNNVAMFYKYFGFEGHLAIKGTYDY